MNYEYFVKIHKGFGGSLKHDDAGEITYPGDLNKEGICAWMYRGDGKNSYSKGMTFKYPEEAGKICPWLLNDIHQVWQVMRFGGEMKWTYEGTEFEKEQEVKGKTNEYIRCIDPTNSGIVIEIAKVAID